MFIYYKLNKFSVVIRTFSNMKKNKFEKKKKIPTVPCNIELVALGGGKGGTCRSLIVNMTHFKYMFNCGEGTQRIATEHKMLKHTKNIFITSGSWNNIGGLMGLCLTLDSAEVKFLQLYGPPLVENYISTSRYFSKLNGLELDKKDILNSVYEDSAMKIKFVSLNKNIKNDICKKRKLESLSNLETAVAYICEPHKKPRSISLDLCALHDVPIGPHLQLLKEGKEVTLPDTKKLIKPDDVLLPEESSQPFIVLECPTIEYIEDLINKEDFKPFLKNNEQKDVKFTPIVIVHFTPTEVMQDERYINWIKLFDKDVDHLILNDDADDLDSEAVHRYQAQLNLLNSNIFPELFNQYRSYQHIKSPLNITYMKTNMKYKIRPFTPEKLNCTSCFKLNFEEEKNKILNNEQIKNLLSNINTNEKNLVNLHQIFPELLFLGTGSAVPNKYRNVSSIWINLSSGNSMMLDCGENAFGQLYRNLGPSKTMEAIKRLKCVFISHLHADHHLGLIGLALNRHNMLKKENITFEPLTVIAPTALLNWYTSIHSLMIPILNCIRIVAVEELYYNTDNKKSEYILQLMKMCDLSIINTVKVMHRQSPHGIIIVHNSGWKLVYSGDTMPCENLIKAGQNCDILIHEATFDDHKFEEAKYKRHSTTSQAIQVGVKMNAKYTILTHFSQRYDKLPLITSNFTENVGIAFDNMRVRFCDLAILHKLIPMLIIAFSEDYSQMLQIQEHKYLLKKNFNHDNI